MKKYYIYKLFFEDNKYNKMESKFKYLLAMMYSHMRESDHKMDITQQYLSEISNIDMSTITLNKPKLKESGFIDYDSYYDIFMKLPSNEEKIFINSEFIEGKYKNLGHGTKLFYTYCLYLQELSGQNNIIYSNEEIKQPFVGSINTIKKYCKELQEVGLLDRTRSGVSHSYHFIEIK